MIRHTCGKCNVCGNPLPFEEERLKRKAVRLKDWRTVIEWCDKCYLEYVEVMQPFHILKRDPHWKRVEDISRERRNFD
jgi:hypothetical protein